jgi:hypothetical protein
MSINGCTDTSLHEFSTFAQREAVALPATKKIESLNQDGRPDASNSTKVLIESYRWLLQAYDPTKSTKSTTKAPTN